MKKIYLLPALLGGFFVSELDSQAQDRPGGQGNIRELFLKEFDKNKDGKIDQEEMRPQFDRAQGGRGGSDRGQGDRPGGFRRPGQGGRDESRPSGPEIPRRPRGDGDRNAPPRKDI